MKAVYVKQMPTYAQHRHVMRKAAVLLSLTAQSFVQRSTMSYPLLHVSHTPVALDPENAKQSLKPMDQAVVMTTHAQPMIRASTAYVNQASLSRARRSILRSYLA